MTGSPAPMLPHGQTAFPAGQSGSAAFHAQEEQRLAALRRTGLFDSEAEQDFDRIVELASQICHVPVALISLVDASRQWFKAVKGLAIRGTPRSESVCNYTIQQSEPLVIEDLRRDARFRENALVCQEGGIRFYAGVPIHSPEGLPLGSLCVLDYAPRTVDQAQLAALVTLAHTVETQIALRDKVGRLEVAETRNRVLIDALVASETRFRTFMDASPIAAYIKDEDGRMQYYNQSVAGLYGVTTQEWLGKTDHELWPPDMADSFRQADLAVLAGGKKVELEERSVQPDGGILIWKSYKFPFVDERGRRCLGGISVDITRNKHLQDLASRLEAAREDERIRVARDLHDDIGPIFSAARMDLMWVRKRLPPAMPALEERVQSIAELLQRGVDAVRRICSGLRPAVLDDMGLVAAIEWQAREFSARTGIPCAVEDAGPDMLLDQRAVTTLFRIFQECLTNILRHAQATAIRVRLSKTEHCALLQVDDNGIGLRDADAVKSLGVLGMAERAQSCGGELKISGRPGCGTSVLVRIPIHYRNDSEHALPHRG